MNDRTTTLERGDAVAEGQPATRAALGHPETPPPADRPRPRTRKIGFIILGALILLAAIAYGVSVLLAPPSVTTEDAYVGGDVVSITAREGGTVLALHADNTQMVRRGQPLIELDPATQDVMLASAEADLGRAVRAVRANQSAVDEAGAEIAQAQAELSRAQNDYGRRRSAAADGAVSGEELAHAQDAVTTARASLNLSRARKAQAASSVAGVSVSNNPQVLAAAAAMRRAAISRSYMSVTAPVTGVVAQRTVQLGQRVAPGTPLMAVVPLDTLWVDANFRETQLKGLRVGQPARIHADVYGDDIVFHGRVLGLGAGSGSAFALLPAQNASGNWIKIVQRVPVRIALDPKELRAHPLRVGLSAKVVVDTSDLSGALVAGSAAPAGGRQESLTGGPQIDARIRQIIAQNSGR